MSKENINSGSSISNEFTNRVAEPSITKFWCHTNIRVIKFDYTWCISNFKYLHEKKISSPEFSSEPDSPTKWKLVMWPEGNSKDDKGYISLFLNLSASDYEPQVQCTFSIIDSTNQPKLSCTFERRMNQGLDWGYPRFIKTADLESDTNNYFFNGSLTIQCKIKASAGRVESRQTIIRSSYGTLMDQLKNDYEKLFKSQKSSDFKLIVKDREFYVHKAVLTSRSSVFAAMLNSGMIECRLNELTINDSDPHVMEEVLKFMYCGSSDAIEELAEDMIPIAQKYNLEGLKMICEEAMSSNLKIDHAADVLDFADVYQCSYLKRNTLAFMSSHLTEVKQTSGYQDMKKSNPSLLLELINEF